jgi:hypothetical protein
MYRTADDDFAFDNACALPLRIGKAGTAGKRAVGMPNNKFKKSSRPGE